LTKFESALENSSKFLKVPRKIWPGFENFKIFKKIFFRALLKFSKFSGALSKILGKI
jgi:hypothetical protein